MIHLGESKSEKSCSFSAAQEPPPALDGSNINVESEQRQTQNGRASPEQAGPLSRIPRAAESGRAGTNADSI
ncbi:unnamed protein product [Penicillium roqueforti FM164]|uniref:Genomic scaffold, ProqFM164S01 n=1 Tax=Penicillium roqueforti (strain FM164) TaxID=1365484 RepID=W6PYB7_PENRF|nr:unnamed protein product [Penicillium roqueforti FM164]